MTAKLGRPILFDYDRMIAFLERRMAKDQEMVAKLEKKPASVDVSIQGFVCKTSIMYAEMILMCAPTWIVNVSDKLDLAAMEQKEREVKE